MNKILFITQPVYLIALKSSPLRNIRPIVLNSHFSWCLVKYNLSEAVLGTGLAITIKQS